MTEQEAQEFLLNLLRQIQLTHESTRQVARGCEATQRGIQNVLSETQQTLSGLTERIKALPTTTAPPTSPSQKATRPTGRRLMLIATAMFCVFVGGTVFAAIGIADGTNLSAFAVWSRIFVS